MKQPVNDKNQKAETVVGAETVRMADGRRLPSVIYNLETNVNRIHQNQTEAEIRRKGLDGKGPQVKAEMVVMQDGSTLQEVVALFGRFMLDSRDQSESRVVDANKVSMPDGGTLTGFLATCERSINLINCREASVDAELHRVGCALSEAEKRDRGTDRQSHESVQRLIKELHGLLEAQNRRIAHLESLNDLIFNREMERRVQRDTAETRPRARSNAQGRFEVGEARFEVGELGINDRFE